NFLWCEFRPDGIRADASWVSGATRVSCLSVLGGNADGAVDTPARCQRLFPAAVAGHAGETADRLPSGSAPLEQNRAHCVRRGSGFEFRRSAALAMAMGGTLRGISAVHSPVGVSRAAASACFIALPGQGRALSSARGGDASALVLRHADSMADSEDPETDFVDSAGQLGGGNLALVSHSAFVYRSRPGERPVHVFADADGDS